ncbi:pimeloyl-ACP methyl esterase BioG family protein [Neisseria leonii]|uniref:pimeloyl-ACP methyl esterase BioG family protein n=1 Tax=Neisseria leonii TaxID=2995413 RepID=UPI00237A6FE9|nr:pimeloyl-ACP methyl esterase BioG family protein [Neisseria sp. 3986]MDD9325917.1 DUF452 family protein [Neisseria sp. 3986]
MRIEYLVSAGGGEAVLYFSGWSFTPDAVRHLAAPEGCDVLACWAYGDSLPDMDLTAYRRVRIVAWSMGCLMAERAAAHWRARGLLCGEVVSAVAVNGTPKPRDRRFGIAPAVFDAVLARLTPQRYAAFRQSCGAAAAHLAARPFDGAAAELAALVRHTAAPAAEPLPWCRALVGLRDRVFPPSAQQRYWQPRCAVGTADAPHYLFDRYRDWQQLWQG